MQVCEEPEQVTHLQLIKPLVPWCWLGAYLQSHMGSIPVYCLVYTSCGTTCSNRARLRFVSLGREVGVNFETFWWKIQTIERHYCPLLYQPHLSSSSSRAWRDYKSGMAQRLGCIRRARLALQQCILVIMRARIALTPRWKLTVPRRLVIPNSPTGPFPFPGRWVVRSHRRVLRKPAHR